MASSPDVKKRQALKKIESELHGTNPVIYRNEMVSVNFAEALRLLMVNTKPVFDILSQTICSEDLERNHHFTEQLLLTGFSSEIQDILESLSYENRKSGAREAESIPRYIEAEHRELEKVIKQLNTPEFSRIDTVLDRIKQLSDICRFAYVTALRLFDINFSSAESYTPNFQDTPPEILESSLLDLYYVSAGMDISNSTCNAIVALYQLYNGNVSEEVTKSLHENLKKIQTLMHHVFNSDNLVGLIRLAKKDPDFEPTKAVYQENSRKKYAEYLENRFQIEGARMKGELQDETISHELNEIFGSTPMMFVFGYNQEANKLLMQNSTAAFIYVMPVQILKSFLNMYYEPHVKPLMNDIVIEGYFNNPAYKSEFSSTVYALNEGLERVKKFEDRFKRGGDFDESLISSLMRDSHKDTAFGGRLKDLVDKINKYAKDMVQTEVNNVFHVYKLCSEILVETKKSHSDVITNLKVLTLSSRNRDNSEILEKQHALWKLFLEIMKNYVIISNVEKK